VQPALIHGVLEPLDEEAARLHADGERTDHGDVVVAWFGRRADRRRRAILRE
jgi:hypothetical protein